MREGPDRLRHWVQNLAFAGTLVVLALVLYAAAITRSAERRQEREAATQTAQARVAATVAAQGTAGAMARATARHEEAYRSTPAPATPQEPISPKTAHRVRLLARWGKGIASAVAYSPDGRYLALGTSIGLYLYDPEVPESPRFLETSSPVQHLAFSRTGDRLALACLDGSLWLWSADEDRLRPLADDLGSVAAIAFSPEGKALAAGYGSLGSCSLWELGWAGCNDSGSCWLWQEGSGVILEFRPPVTTTEQLTPVPVLALSGNGRYVGIGWYGGPFQLWDVGERKLLGQRADLQGLQQLAFSPDGSLLASGSREGTVHLWQLPQLEPVGTLETSMGYVSALAFSPGGQLLASAGQQTIRIWDVRNRVLLRILERRQEEPLFLPPGSSQLAFSPRGKELVSIAAHDSVLISDLDTRTNTPLPLGFTPPWVDAAETGEGRRLAALADDGRVWIWRTESGALERVLEAPSWAYSPRLIVSQYVSGSMPAEGPILVLPETRVVRVGDRTFTLSVEMPYPYLWPTATVTWVGQATTTVSLEGVFSPRMLPRPDMPGIAFLPDGGTLGVRAYREDIALWDVTNGRFLGWLLEEIPLAERYSGKVVFSPDGKWLAAPGDGGATLLMARGADSEPHSVAGHEQLVAAIAFSPDSQYLATGSVDGVVLLRRASDSFRSCSFVTREPAPVSSLAFSPDASLLALGRFDGTVRLIETETLLPVAELLGHTMWVSDLTFSADGRRLFTASSDGTIRLWGVGK